jgi:pimeloyl-ACP methyl ester carboxylesterase
MTVRRTALVLLATAALACRGPRLDRGKADCTHVQAAHEVRGTPLCEDVWTCGRPPGGRFDRVGLHRLAPCDAANGPVVLYLPGMHMNGELPIDDPRHDLRVYLAAAGMRTWGVDYRTHAVPADTPARDLDALDRWTADVFADDAAWALAFVRGIDAAPVYVAGFSHGAAIAYRLAARRDTEVAGLLILDGAAGGARGADQGGSAIDVGGSRLPFPERQRLLAAVIADPGSPSPVPGFASSGAALAELLYSAPSFGGHGGLSSAREGASDIQVLATLLRSYDRWWPRAALEDRATTPARQVRVLAFASTGMGPAWVERLRASARAQGGDAAVVRELPGYGHLDVLVGRHAVQEVFEPARAWLAAP